MILQRSSNMLVYKVTENTNKRESYSRVIFHIAFDTQRFFFNFLSHLIYRLLLSTHNPHIIFEMPPRFLRIAFAFRSVFCVCLDFVLFRPEFSYRPGLGPVSEDTTTTTTTPLTHGSGGPPNRPLPPTPDDDDQAGDRTLIMKRVSTQSYCIVHILFHLITIL